MECPRCGFNNRDDARFCKQCGTALRGTAPRAAEAACSACGAPLKPAARFCPRCGSAVGSVATPPPMAAAAPPSARDVAPAPMTPPPIPRAPVATPAAVPPATPMSATPPLTAPPRAVPGVTRWLWALIAAGLTWCLACCGVLGLALLPALGQTPPPFTREPPNHDLSIMVRESYLNRNLTALLPGNGLRNAQLDVRPGNLVVTTANFEIFLVQLRVEIVSRIAVVDGEIEITVERIDTGGLSVLDLLGQDNFTLGKNFTQALRQRLEQEIGEGARLLEISTDEEHIILRARF